MSTAEQFAGKHDCYRSSRRYRGERGLDSRRSAQRFPVTKLLTSL